MSVNAIYCFVIYLLVVTKAEEPSRLKRSLAGKRPIVTSHDLNLAVKVAEDFVSRLQRLEGNLAGTGIQVREDSPSHGQLIDSYPFAEALMIGRNALIANRASLYLVQRHCKKSNIALGDCVESLSKWSFLVTPLGEKCNSQFGSVKCTANYPYRSFDGTCNHLIHPTWGQSFTAYSRLLPAHYADGIFEFRKSASKRPLPSPRFISNILTADLDKPEKEKTLALAQWTQFIGNDMFHTAVNKMFHTGNAIECCRYDGKNLSPRYIHPICQQISIPSDDPDYSPHGAVCMNYVRSLTSFRHACNFGPADQLNQATHYLDGSMIYGSSSSKAISLRTMNGGRLATSIVDNDEYLAASDAPEDHCQIMNGETICYKSGDPRVNQHPHHTAVYTIWVREHNRIASALEKINPYWDDEKVFQEARKIVIAEIQHITYKYWVPFVLGEVYTRSIKLDVKAKGFSNSFDEDADPSISNSFATVGFRYVNSMMQSKLKLYDRQGIQNDTLFLKDHFNRPGILQEPGILDQLLRGLSIQTSQKLDPYMVEDLTSLLFRGSSSIGQDIMSLDIQRGRDHGLPGYNQFRKFCKLPSSNKFETFLDTIPQSTLNKIKLVYDHPDDVDLIVGAMSEVPADDSILGPTLRCIIGEQMLRTRAGDRFFYDIVGKPHSFKESQINEIKKSSLARVICDSVKNIDKIQIDVFKVPSNKNPYVSCDDARIPKMNLNEWKSIT